jgi:thiamine-monophosphate kinase
MSEAEADLEGGMPGEAAWGERTVRDVGEFGLIEALRDALPAATVADPSLDLGIGDDAAVWRPEPGESLVVTADSLVEGVHFRLDPGWSTWADLGHKALAVNLSDLAAMGAAPALATVSLGLRGTERVADLVAAYHALGDLAARAGCLIAGGDIVASPVVTVHVTAIGRSRNGRMLTRAGARVGDLIAVSGTLGAAAAGLRLLGEAPDDPRRRAATADALLAAHRRPVPRLALGELLLARGATAAMDLSDGLLGDLPKILAASGVAAEVDLAALPVAAAVRSLFPDEWPELATRGGEDFELLFTVPPDRFSALRDAADGIGATVTAIGAVVEASPGQPILALRGIDGVVVANASGAFDHFRHRGA